MWFRFPEGTREISVQLQNFFPEAKDVEGRDCFRAPDHFAHLILDLPGFGVGKPLGNLEDLPKPDHDRDRAIGQLTGQIEGLKAENEGLKAALAETRAERDDFKLKTLNLTAELSQLQDEGGKNMVPEKQKA